MSLAQWFGNLLSATALALPCVASLETLNSQGIKYTNTQATVLVAVHQT